MNHYIPCPGCGRYYICGRPYQYPQPYYGTTDAGWRNGISASPSGAVPGSTPGPVTNPPPYDVPGNERFTRPRG